MKINNLPEKYEAMWEKALPILKKSRPGDDMHAKETVELILNYKGNLKFDEAVIIPVAMMHDIGHAAILDEHFQYVTGPKKIENAKLVHMLTGAKIAKDILDSLVYDPKLTKEIVDIISIHDFDQLKNVDWKKVYDTDNKKFFHDIDALDRYTETRIKNVSFTYSRNELIGLLEKMLELFIFDEFREKAEKAIANLKK
jgi:hypothetical protein